MHGELRARERLFSESRARLTHRDEGPSNASGMQHRHCFIDIKQRHWARRLLGKMCAGLWSNRRRAGPAPNRRARRPIAGGRRRSHRHRRGWIGDASSRIVFSPDGKFVTATSEQVKIPLRLWDTRTERLVRRLGELDPLGSADHVAFSNDSALIATASEGGAIRVGSTATGRKICELVGPGSVYAIVFSPDGKRVHAHDVHQKTLWTWDIASGKATRCLFLGRWPIAFSPDGKWVAIPRRDGTMSVRDLTTWDERRRFGTHGRPVAPWAFSPDGKRLATSGRRGSIQVWDIATGRVEGRFPGLRARLA